MADQIKQTIAQRAERRRLALQTPRAAAVAGILFAVLVIVRQHASPAPITM